MRIAAFLLGIFLLVGSSSSMAWAEGAGDRADIIAREMMSPF